MDGMMRREYLKRRGAENAEEVFSKRTLRPLRLCVSILQTPEAPISYGWLPNLPDCFDGRWFPPSGEGSYSHLLITQHRLQPTLALFHRDPFELRIVFGLVLGDLIDRKVTSFRMGKIQATHRSTGPHRKRFG